MVRLYKAYVQPVIHYGALIYGCANKTDLKDLEWSQNKILRIIFSLEKSESLRDLKNREKNFSIFEIHIYELFKIMSSCVRQDHNNEVFKNMITEVEIVKSVGVQGRKKPLKTRERATTENNKLIVTRVRKLYNKILQMDEYLIKSIMSAEKYHLEKLVHDFKDNFILCGSELVNVFW